MIKYFLSLLILSFLFISCQQQQQDLPEPAEDIPVHDRLIAVINPTVENEAAGVVTFTREGDNVRVIATITGLEPESMHGFHIHQYGDCSDESGLSAGGHFNPFGMPHGSPTDTERHVGDLGNLTSDADGVASLDYVDTVLDLDGAFSILGRGVVVHAGEDDLESQPTGDAGSRIGCGVIGVAQPLE
jgi:superoxide dismutase, Cu-Zn family